MRRILSLLFALTLLTAACGDSDGDDTTAAVDGGGNESVAEEESSGEPASDSPTSDSTQATTQSPSPAADAPADELASVTADPGKPTIEVTGERAPTGLAQSDIVVGDGAVAGRGALVELHYVGVKYADGSQFDASWDRDQTFFVPVGAGAVIPGFDQGIEGMAVGGRRLLVIPPELAYGSAGAGGVIGPDETLIFVIDLVSIFDAERPEVPLGRETPTELVIEDVVVGEGDPVETGDTVTVHYQGTLLDGTPFDASWDRGTPFTTQIGVGRVIPGWDQGIVGMTPGGRRILVIPSDLAYGEQGSGAVIGPNTPLVFVVDLISVSS